jgi:L-threonylcarbamoyladenylate synthase
MYYVKGDDAALNSVIDAKLQAYGRVGVLIPGGRSVIRSDDVKLVHVHCGHQDDIESIARDLYACIRSFDEARDPVDVIVASGFPTEGLGAAIMNRLLKASSDIIE